MDALVCGFEGIRQEKVSDVIHSLPSRRCHFRRRLVILVSAAIRRTSIAKLITIVFTAAVVAFFEWLMIWAPSTPARTVNLT
jgi:hypothetical protein